MRMGPLDSTCSLRIVAAPVFPAAAGCAAVASVAPATEFAVGKGIWFFG